jgi:hypothetical protein
VTVNGIATTSTNGLTFVNNTPATVGVPVQYSPRTCWTAQGWQTNTPASESVVFCVETQPTQGAADPGGALYFTKSVNGAAFTRVLSINQSGTLTTGGLLQINTSGSLIGNSSDGVVALYNNAATDFTRLQFGGTTAAYPSWARSSTAPFFKALLADASGYTSVGIGSLYLPNTILTFASTVPTLSSGFGASSALVAGTVTTFRWNVGTGGVATTGVLNVASTASTGWNCTVSNLTAKAAHRADDTVQTASTTTTITVENQTVSTGAAVAWAASDILKISCTGF